MDIRKRDFVSSSDELRKIGEVESRKVVGIWNLVMPE
jgi:hypothetical protein